MSSGKEVSEKIQGRVYILLEYERQAYILMLYFKFLYQLINAN